MDRKWLIIGLLAVGALVLLTHKKPKRRRIRALSGITKARSGQQLLDEVREMKNINQLIKDLDANDENTKLNDILGFLYTKRSMATKDIPYLRGASLEYAKGMSEYLTEQIMQIPPDLGDKTVKEIWQMAKGKPPTQMKLFGLSGLSLNRRKVCRADVTKKKIHCRVQNPKEFGAFFMRTSTTPGVKYVMGMPLGTEKAVLQSVLFDKHIWDTRQAKTWFNRNINRLMKRDKKTLRLDDLGKGKIHDEDYFSPRQIDMFPGMRRELVLEAEDNASILTVDPLDVCLERQGWEIPKVRKYQESISAKMTPDMFGKVEKLSGKEVMLQETIQQCLERITKR
jgi:hypothetical protein